MAKEKAHTVIIPVAIKSYWYDWDLQLSWRQNEDFKDFHMGTNIHHD